jgi:hypothetical protein
MFIHINYIPLESSFSPLSNNPKIIFLPHKIQKTTKKPKIKNKPETLHEIERQYRSLAARE